MNTHERLKKTALAIAARPWPVILTFAVVLAVALFAASRLEFDTAIEDMLPPGHPSAEAYIELTKKFDTTSNLLVVVEGPDRASIIGAAHEFARLITADPGLADLIRSVRLEIDRDFLEKWGLLLQDADELEDRIAMFEKTNLLPFLRSVNETIETSLSDGSASVEDGNEEEALVSLMTGFELFAADLGALANPRDTESRDTESRDTGSRDAESQGATGETSDPPDSTAVSALVDDVLVGERYMIDPEGRTLLLVVTPSFDLGERDKLSALAVGASRLGGQVASRHPGARFGFAGDVAVEADEEKALGADSFYPSLVALGAIFVLFLLSMKSIRAILLSLVALAAGIILDLGFAALAIGELNMITSSFGVLLVGLGIDFSIHFASRFDDARDGGSGIATAIAESMDKVFVPVCVGALTTAAAFYSLLFSGSAAFRQFGLIAGTGIVACLLATFTLFPALLAAFPGKAGSLRKERRTLTFATLSRLGLAAGRRRNLTLAAAAVLAAAALVLAGGNRFEHDFRAIGPRGTASRSAAEVVEERFRISTYTSLASAGTLEEARELGKRALAAPYARRVESLADYIAGDIEQDRRLEIISRIRNSGPRSEPVAWTAATVEAFAAELQRLEWNLTELTDLAAAAFGEDSLALRKRDLMIREIRGAETGAPGREAFRNLADSLRRAASVHGGLVRLSALDVSFANALSARIDAMATVTRRMTEADLPDDLVRELRSPERDAYLVSVQPSRSMQRDEDVRKFAAGLTAIDQGFTGSLQLGYEFSRTTLEEARKSALLVAILVFAFTLLGFRSLKYALAAFITLGFGIALLFGIYPYFAKFNIVSILALPLILGIGVDYAVHAATSFQSLSNLSGRKRLAAALADTRKPIALSALTTIIGFGSLALVASFKGIMDLGLILSLGIALCTLSTYIVLPALLSLEVGRGKRSKSPVGLEEAL